MTDSRIERMRELLRQNEQKHLCSKFLKEHIADRADDIGARPEELRDSIPSILAALRAIEDFKQCLKRNNVPYDVYPTIAAEVMTDGTNGRHPEEVRSLTEQLIHCIGENAAPVSREHSDIIALEDNSPYGGPTLLCPHCDGNYLHHCGVTIYDRGEDAETLTRTEVTEGISTTRMVPSVGSGNPSARRDGLAIRFWCELCTATDIELTVEQHKGQTFLGWRYGLSKT